MRPDHTRDQGAPGQTGRPGFHGGEHLAGAPAPLAPPAPKRTGPAPSFGELVQIVSDSVHSGSGRTALADNTTDYYPVPLSADTLRPAPSTLILTGTF